MLLLWFFFIIISVVVVVVVVCKCALLLAMLPPKELREDVNAAIPLHLIAAFLTLLTFIVLFTFAIIDVVGDTVLVANIIFFCVYFYSLSVLRARARLKNPFFFCS
jgi:hypothetical protein